MARLKKIGRSDVANFPQLGLERVEVKIDTGAYTSSIHGESIRVYKRNDKQFLRFELMSGNGEDPTLKEYVFTDFNKRVIKNSFGETEDRYVIETEIELFNKVFTIELSLTHRGTMKFPVLLGRKMLENRFVVDVAQANLSFNSSNKNKK